MSLFNPFSLRIGRKLVEVKRPLVMGIINATPDSFYASSRAQTERAIATRAEQMMAEGVDIIDLGAYSSRPGASDVTDTEEAERLSVAMRAIRSVDRGIPVSIDTFRARVAEQAITEMDANIINDISGGALDGEMFATVSRLKVPYILMHMRGTPATMQQLCDYPAGVAAEVVAELSSKLRTLEELGVADIIIDPGFGFSKTLEQNYELMRAMPAMAELWHRPLLVGISRKSMLTRALGITADDALEPTVALNMAALHLGASILRVHDVLAARQSIEIFTRLYSPS